MTNYGSTSNATTTIEYLSELWNDICKKHWNYLETEESLEKIEERVKLETCLTDYLCLVPHDRKFLLPETNHVLKKSILYMQDFSAYKACIGFESISQYANNLFTKPWRKEYKVIKMFSGFFQHEIRTNLLDAERLFEAMGYKMLPNQTLALDGAICPDQVTNVSRDAMAAYVECQIIKHIYSGLTKLQMSCSWLDIYNFREHNVGTASQAIKMIAYSIQEKQYRKNVIGTDNCYNQVLPVSPVSAAAYNQCAVHSCSQCNKQQMHYQIPYMPPSSCSVHTKPVPASSSVQPPPPPPAQYAFSPQIPHSKSLDQYDPNGLINTNMQPHRHSFDHHYEFGNLVPNPNIPPMPSYDCIDGAHAACNFNAFNSHPYNVSGNRFPLPYNLSNSLNNGGYAIPNGNLNKGYAVPNNCYTPTMTAPPIPSASSAKMIHPDEFYTTRTSGYYSGIPQVQQQQQQPPPPPLDPGIMHNNKYTSIASQANVGTLIDLDPKPYPTSILKKDTRHTQSSHINNSSSTKRYKDLLSGDFVPSNFEKTSRNSDFDSYDDDLSKSTAKSSSQATKIQDGIGSYESWNYVFKNLEKQGYTKDLGPRHDGLDDDELGLDLDRLNIQTVDPPPPPIVERSTKAHIRNSSSSSMKAPELPSKPSKHNKTTTSAMTNNNNHHHHPTTTANSINGRITTSQQPNGSIHKKTLTTQPPPMPSPVNNEWSCRFCTFLNNESKRICEMCAKSRDFNLDATGKTTTATCV
uniref:CSON011802 protein n=1 Tax=Culicoides sonorensis TaxID=179676 RepID=A0A336M805_CULSO